MIKYQVIRKIKGFYYVTNDFKEIYECKLKGTLKENNSKFNCMIGDIVELNEEKDLIIHIEDRKNFLIRPFIANVDCVFITYSVINPNLDYINLQKNLLYIDSQNIKRYLILTKIDLIDENELKEIKKHLYSILPNLEIIENNKLDAIKNMLENNKINVFMGVSGVGKSTLLNKLLNRNDIVTQEISEKLKRGKNTTVETRIYEYKNVCIVDTPGFLSLDFPNINNIHNVYKYMPDLIPFANCKFKDCDHINIKEELCGVLKAVKEKQLSLDRYNFFKMFYEKG